MKRFLSGDVELYTYRVPYVKSTTILINVRTGSVDETPEISGVSHFIEHTVFRGSLKYSARELKNNIESVGGSVNAWTDKENTSYYARVPVIKFRESFDMMWDMIRNPRLEEKSVDMEKSVIQEEYRSTLEEPVTRVNEMVFENFVKGDHLKSIIGNEKSIGLMNSDKLRDYFKRFYTPSNIQVLIVGCMNDDDVAYVKDLVKSSGGIKKRRSVSKIEFPDE